MKTVTEYYLMGIREGREMLNKYGDEDARGYLETAKLSIKSGFTASSPVGQMLRGERDFWMNYLKGKK